MNFIWSFMIILPLCFGVVQGTSMGIISAGLEGAKAAVETVLGFAGFMCFWSGVLALCEKGGLAKIISKLLSPILSRLFGKSSATPHIAMNVTANLLGMGNAATPAGISAMKELDKENRSDKPSRSMCIFAVMNTASLQIVPTTVAAMRAAAGSSTPFDIMPAVWVTSIASLTASLAAVMLIYKRR